MEGLAGTRFPGGSHTIEPYKHWLMSDATLGEQPRVEGAADPMWVFYTALAGMGLSIDDLFGLVGAKASDGVMFGATDLELHRPLRIGGTYRVSGGITKIERKEGRRAGAFDIVTFRLELADEDGAEAAVCTNSFIFPRRDG
jgi:acyl dehydratase